jgi:hypothetical protein
MIAKDYKSVNLDGNQLLWLTYRGQLGCLAFNIPAFAEPVRVLEGKTSGPCFIPQIAHTDGALCWPTSAAQ